MAYQEPALFEAARTAAELSDDERIAEQCRVREEYYLEQLAQLRHVQRLMAELNAAKAELAFLTALESKLSGEKDELARKDEEIAELRRQIAEASPLRTPEQEVELGHLA